MTASKGLFYGWRVVAACFVVAAFAWGLGLFGSSVYLQAVTARHGWPVSEVASAITLFFLVSALIQRTVGRAIDFVSGFYPDWNTDRCDRLQQAFGVHRSERIDTLSFGSRVKLATLLALSRDAELLLLDEPTAGLDPLARQQLFAELLRFMRDENRTIVISSHQLADLERFADHVAVMQAGQVITYGSIPELLERYVQLDVQLPRNAGVQNSVLRAISRQQDRACVLLDRWSPQRQSLEALGAEVIGETSLTLEELFIALMKTGRSRWQPKLSAA